MPIHTFVLYTTLGSAVWNGVLIGAGWVMAEQWATIRPMLQRSEYLPVGLLAAVLIVLRCAASEDGAVPSGAVARASSRALR